MLPQDCCMLSLAFTTVPCRVQSHTTLICTVLQVRTARIFNVPLLRPLLLQAVSAAGDGDKLVEWGPFKLSRTWIRGVLRLLKMSYRKATTAAQKTPEDWEKIGLRFVKR